MKNDMVLAGTCCAFLLALFGGTAQVAAQKPIAAWKSEAVKGAKITQAYVLPYEEHGEQKAVWFEHRVTKAEFTEEGKFTLTDADKTVLTSWKAGDKQVTVTFQEIQHRANQDGTITNILIFTGDDGSEFQFIVDPRSSMRHTLSSHKGDVVSYLSKKAAGTTGER